MKTYITLLVAAIIIGGFTFAGCTNKDTVQQDERVLVKLSDIKKEELPTTIVSSGQFSTEDETFLSFKMGGIVKKIFVKEGDQIKKGQVLAILEPTEIEGAVLQARAAFEKATRDYNRVSNLYNDSVATLAQFQDAKTALEIATQQMNIAKFNRSYSEIRAIGNGYILKKFLSEGQLAGSGTAVLQTNGASEGHWILKVGVSDLEWSLINTKDNAWIEIDALPGTKYEAKVYRKSKGVDPYSGTFSVDLELSSRPVAQLATGLFARATIQTSRQQSCWVVPYEAILDGNGNTGFVFVTNDQKTARKVKVEIAELREDKVLIANGLEEAKALIVSGNAYLTDGSIISIVN